MNILDFISVMFGLLIVASAMVNLHLNSPAHERSVAGIVGWLIVAIASAAVVASMVCGR